MKTDDIIGHIANCLQNYENTSLSCNPVFAKTPLKILELIDLYSMDKYRDNNYDSLGFLKPFYNIVDTPVQVAANYLDIDVKNVEFVAEEGQSYYPVLLYERDVKYWMKDNRNCYADGRDMSFGLFLNSLVLNWPKYGHLVVKKAGNKIFSMPLSNLTVEPGAESLANASYIIEKHDYSPSQLREMKWDNIEKAIKKCQTDGHIFVYELYGEVKKLKENYFIIAVKPHKSLKNLGKGILLHSDTLKELPYKELPWEKIAGRWLGRGRIEKLFHPQIYQNKIATYKAHGAHWTSKHLYQTKDETFDKNLTTEVKDGRVLTPLHPIEPVMVEERNLSFYREEEQRYDLLVDKRTFTWDITRGQRAPAGLTLGQSILQSRAAGGFYKRKKDELGLFLKDILFDWIIPQFKGEKNKAHKLILGEFNESELTRLRETILIHKANKATIDWIKRNGRIPSGKEYGLLKGITQEHLKKAKDIGIPEDYYKGIRYKINIIITGEQIDLASRITTLQMVLTMISQNPTILQDPNTRKVFFQLLDLVGISPAQFEKETPELSEAVSQFPEAKRGGSLARIPAVTTPGTVEVPRRL